ncbi:hypothetical protein VNO77_16074 [Canavalia gladiata]|uniref:Secreted protein n=1 Tax=Canavalia gladiata TaxID=3824 RepID=A0AAN9QPL7_CANGL
MMMWRMTLTITMTVFPTTASLRESCALQQEICRPDTELTKLQRTTTVSKDGPEEGSKEIRPREAGPNDQLPLTSQQSYKRQPEAWNQPAGLQAKIVN